MGELPSQNADTEWSLTSGHPQDTSGMLHKLHTLDIYFWNVDDARLFLTTAQRVLEPSQIDIITTQPPAHAAPVSTVVQQLEQVAISDPGYHGQHPSGGVQTQPTNIPPPPPGAAPFPPTVTPVPPSTQPSTGRVSPLDEAEQPALPKPQEQKQESFAPLAYNPAAPAAPEPIQHREKTPPPPDAGTGTGLAAAAAREQGVPFSSMPPPPPTTMSMQGNHHQPHGFSQPPEGQPLFTSPPVTAELAQPIAVSSPPPHGNPSFGPTAGPALTGSPSTIHSTTTSYQQQPPSQDPNMGIYRQQTFGSPPVPETYASQQFQQQPPAGAYVQPQQMQFPPVPGMYGQPQAYQQSQAPQPQVPIGGYSEYNYGQPQQTANNPYDVHNQVYRPTETEHKYHHGRGAGSISTPGERKPGKITENAMRVEKGMNKLFKKLEKKL